MATKVTAGPLETFTHARQQGEDGTRANCSVQRLTPSNSERSV